MRTLRNGTLALIALAMWGTPARSDDFVGMVPEEGAIQVMLLRQKCVRDELKLSDNEAQKIKSFNDQQWKKAEEIQRLAPDQRLARYDALTRENELFLSQTLKPQERRRLDEISLQVAGLLMATSPRIASQLGLNQQQIQELIRHQNEARTELNEALRAESKQGREERIKQLSETSHKRLTDVLTDAQEAKWKQLSGEKFEGKFKFDEENSK
jgi:hypothetical protein